MGKKEAGRGGSLSLAHWPRFPFTGYWAFFSRLDYRRALQIKVHIALVPFLYLKNVFIPFDFSFFRAGYESTLHHWRPILFTM